MFSLIQQSSHLPNLHIISLTVSILTELRQLLSEQANELSPFIIAVLTPARDRVFSHEWSSLSLTERSVMKDLLFLLTRCKDKRTQEYLDDRFGDNLTQEIEEEWKEIRMFRYLQRHVNSQNYQDEVNSILSRSFDNQNTFILSALSGIEDDAILAYLIQYVTRDNCLILTQNIMYLFKYFSTNIS